MKVGASKGIIRVDYKKSWSGGSGQQETPPPGYATAEESVEGRYTREKEERTTENKMERRMPTRFAKYGTKSGRGDGQGDLEKKDHLSYRRPYMMGKARGKKTRGNTTFVIRVGLG